MRVLKRSPGGFAVILKNENVLEAAVFLQIEDAVAEGPEHVFNALGGQAGEAQRVVGRLDDRFVGANSVHLVEHAFGLLGKIAFDTESRKLVGNHANGPSGAVFLRGATVRVWP